MGFTLYFGIMEKAHCRGEATVDCAGQQGCCSEGWCHPLTSFSFDFTFFFRTSFNLFFNPRFSLSFFLNLYQFMASIAQHNSYLYVCCPQAVRYSRAEAGLVLCVYTGTTHGRLSINVWCLNGRLNKKKFRVQKCSGN